MRHSESHIAPIDDNFRSDRRGAFIDIAEQHFAFAVVDDIESPTLLASGRVPMNFCVHEKELGNLVDAIATAWRCHIGVCASWGKTNRTVLRICEEKRCQAVFNAAHHTDCPDAGNPRPGNHLFWNIEKLTEESSFQDEVSAAAWAMARFAWNEAYTGSGRTTAGLMITLAKAIQNQGEWITYIDHSGIEKTKERVESFLGCLKSKAEENHLLDFEFDIINSLPAVCCTFYRRRLNAQQKKLP
jgi:hypothetical protein